MDVKAVLVAVEHPGGRGGVLIDLEGDVWLAGSLEVGCAVRLDDHQPAAAGLEGGEHTLLGGRLPAGAVSAEAVSASGERVACEVGTGAWAVVLEQPLRGPIDPVLFRDDTGRPVPAPLPVEWARVPVTDTDERCPACEALAWDVVTPTDRSHGARSGPGPHGMEPAPVIVCRVCGYEERMGAIMRMEIRDDEDPAVVQARIRESEEARRISLRMVLSATTFAIYAVEGAPGRIAGSGSRGDDVSSVTVAHGADGNDTPGPHVTTAVDDEHVSDETLAREALEQCLYDGLPDWTGGSDAAFVLRLSADERARRRSVSHAAATVRELPVDGVPTSFTYVQTDDRWAAVARTGAATITITASSSVAADTVRVCSVSDPVQSLL